MDQLRNILVAELDKYTGEGANALVFPVYDDSRQHYALIVVDYPTRQQFAEAIIIARIVEDKIVIEEDMTDKKLVDALLQQGVPREQIVLAYDNEKAPAPPIPVVRLK